MSVGSVIGPAGAGGPDGSEDPDRRRRGLRALLYGVIALLVLVLLAAAGIVIVAQQLGSQVGRYPSVFAPIDPSARPADAAGDTFLLVGTDTRSPEATTGADATAPDFVFGQQRSDVIMVATIAEDGQSASVVSIPRDSWVEIPGRGMNKINAAYSFGGPPLLIETVEQLTRVRVDHFAVIDFAGFAQMTDAVGGIDVTVGQASQRGGVVVPSGTAAPRRRPGAGLRPRALHPARRRPRPRQAPAGRAAGAGAPVPVLRHALQPHPGLRAGGHADPLRRRRRHPDQHRSRPARVRAARPALVGDHVHHRARDRHRDGGRPVGGLPRRGRGAGPLVRGQHRRRPRWAQARPSAVLPEAPRQIPHVRPAAVRVVPWGPGQASGTW